MNEREDRIIRASEIGRYAYCAHAWWLGNVRGLPSAHQRELAAGAVVHRRHGRRVQVTARLSILAYALLALALLVAASWLRALLDG